MTYLIELLKLNTKTMDNTKWWWGFKDIRLHCVGRCGWVWLTSTIENSPVSYLILVPVLAVTLCDSQYGVSLEWHSFNLLVYFLSWDFLHTVAYPFVSSFSLLKFIKTSSQPMYPPILSTPQHCKRSRTRHSCQLRPEVPWTRFVLCTIHTSKYDCCFECILLGERILFILTSLLKHFLMSPIKWTR